MASLESVVVVHAVRDGVWTVWCVCRELASCSILYSDSMGAFSINQLQHIVIGLEKS